MNEQGLEELKERLVSGVESLVESEAAKLKRAVENPIGYCTAEQDGAAALLVSAGLLKRAGNAAGLHKEEFYYEATPEGRKLYSEIYRK